MSDRHTKTNKFSVTITICATVILLALIGSWVYVQRQNVAQKDRELQQQKQLKEYEQQQINARNKANNDTEQYKSRYSSGL